MRHYQDSERASKFEDEYWTRTAPNEAEIDSENSYNQLQLPQDCSLVATYEERGTNWSDAKHKREPERKKKLKIVKGIESCTEMRLRYV